MTSAIHNKAQVQKAKRYIIGDTSDTRLDTIIEDAIVTSSREISDIGKDIPLAWNKEVYDELFTRYYAEISAITAADPGVITADSVDPDLTSDHGFQTADIIYLDGVNGSNSLHRLNQRLFRAVRASATTITLKTLDGQTAIDTSDYEAYDSGGKIYHAGFVIAASTLEPSSGTDYKWAVKRFFDVNVDGYPCDPISHEQAVKEQINRPGSRPKRWRYQQYGYGAFTTVEHMILWYPYPSQRFNIKIHIEKDYPDIATFTSAIYPPHPNFIHDFIWRRALAKLAAHAEKTRRRSAGKEGEMGDNTKMEVLNANYWIREALSDELKILNYSRKLEGNQSFISQGISA